MSLHAPNTLGFANVLSLVLANVAAELSRCYVAEIVLANYSTPFRETLRLYSKKQVLVNYILKFFF